MVRHSESEQISWEAQRANLPERPTFSSNLNAEALIERPKRTLVAAVLFVIAALAIVSSLVGGALVLDALRENIVAALPDDVTAEYSEESVAQAATVLLAVVAALLLVSVAAQAMSLGTCIRKRSRTARVTFAVASSATILALGVSLLLREPSINDIALSVTACGLALLAVALICTPRVTRWLRRSEERRKIVLADAVSKLSATEE